MPSPPDAIVVPGSISNLGPGFDALSVAVSVYLRLTAIDVLPQSPGTLEMDFGAATPPGVYNPPPINTYSDRVRNCIHSYPLNAGIGNNPTDQSSYIRQCSN